MQEEAIAGSQRLRKSLREHPAWWFSGLFGISQFRICVYYRHRTRILVGPDCCLVDRGVRLSRLGPCCGRYTCILVDALAFLDLRKGLCNLTEEFAP